MTQRKVELEKRMFQRRISLEKRMVQRRMSLEKEMVPRKMVLKLLKKVQAAYQTQHQATQLSFSTLSFLWHLLLLKKTTPLGRGTQTLKLNKTD